MDCFFLSTPTRPDRSGSIVSNNDILKNHLMALTSVYRSTRLIPIIALVMFACGIVLAAEPPRERLLMDFGWRFHLGDAPDAGNKFDYPEASDLTKTHVNEIGLEGALATNVPDPVASNLGGDVSFVQTKFSDSGWRLLDLPHDWAVELPFDEKADVKHGFKPVGPGFPQNSIGWYRREFELPASDKGKVLWLEFDGVYRNSLVWLNGHCLGRHPDGYGSFRCDISRLANYGGKNEIVVRVDANRFEGWFYEGAGIYRHVWLEKTQPLAIAPDGIFVWSSFSNNVPQGAGEVHVQAQLNGSVANDVKISFEVIDPSGKMAGKTEQSAKAGSSSPLEAAITLSSPQLWSPESPALYKLITTVTNDGKVVDRIETEFGIRTVAFDATNGFLLNGRPYTLKGTCNHQDHAGVGSAMPDALQYYRVAKLKEMGGNAYRTSHNPPTPELLEACDRLGMLVMDENRRMDTSAQTVEDLKQFVLRDRNHPCIFIWSLGNEENYLQGRAAGGVTTAAAKEAGAHITAMMQNLIHQFDPTRRCTVAMNGGWGEGISTVVEVQGFNYRTTNIGPFHEQFPNQSAIGTETASTRTTRGIYADDKAHGYVAAYGENGISKAWGWWPYYATNPFTSGGFVWTGFDYRGEPTPYKWPCINSHYGIMDMCGFPKDIFYYYQSWWTDKPVLHIAPHWNWPDQAGKEVRVRVFSNCKEVELFLNGKSLGKQMMEPNGYLDWKVNYEPGVLSAKGYDGDKLITDTKVETTGTPVAVRLSPDRTTIKADRQDVSVVDVSIVDGQGRVVPVADNLVHFELSGPGKIIGVGNGDPSSHEADKANERKTFNGYAQVIVQSGQQAGAMILTATAKGLKVASAKIQIEGRELTRQHRVPML
jgi:beta-galactosidase